MFKLIVLSTFLALVIAHPGLLNGGHVATIATAPAVSSQSRHDLINPGVAVATTVAQAPAVAVAPVATSVAYSTPGAALTSRLDIRRPVHGAVVAPVSAVAASPVATIAAGPLAVGGRLLRGGLASGYGSYGGSYGLGNAGGLGLGGAGLGYGSYGGRGY